jgi:FAD-dependent urate hydroxylase
MERCDVAIVGAGPYGLSAAAYLREIEGLDVCIFGKVMSFWRQCMPPRMLLRSVWRATHIAAPNDRLTLDEYVSQNGDRNLGEPIPLSAFVRYGQWFHDRVGAQGDERKVSRIERSSSGFQVSLEDGAWLQAERVLLATGIESHAYKPEEFRNLPRELVSHVSELRDYEAFRGKRVIVIGGAQSALEASVFLHDGGADVELLVRGEKTRPGSPVLQRLIDPKPLKFLYGRGGVGRAGISLLIQQPHLYSRFSEGFRAKWDRKSTKLGFSYRLVPTMNGTPIHYGRCVERASVRGDRVALRLRDGSERTADHVVLGTGYRVDTTRCSLLSPRIFGELKVVNGYPVLDAGLESSVPGLHFLGAPAAYSFGPLLRFVAGTGFASSAVARRIRAAKGRQLHARSVD